jgi:hypothetical protein
LPEKIGGRTRKFAYNRTFKLFRNILLDCPRVFMIEDRNFFKNNFNFLVLIFGIFPSFLILILIPLPPQFKGEGKCPAFTLPPASAHADA